MCKKIYKNIQLKHDKLQPLIDKSKIIEASTKQMPFCYPQIRLKELS